MKLRIVKGAWIGRLLQALGVNSVPAVGFYGEGWSIGTTLSLYWIETVLVTILVAARIVLHRRWTRKAGHWDVPVEIEATGGGRTTVLHRRTTYLAAFLSVMIPFTAGHGLFLGAIILLVLPELTGAPADVSLLDLNDGAKAIALFLVLGLAFDLVGLGHRSFQWIERVADRARGRMLLTHLTIVFGMGAMMIWEAPAALFGLFVGLKTLNDLGSVLPERAPSLDPPRWLAWLDRVGTNKKGDTFAAHYRKSVERDRRAQEAKERVLGPGDEVA